MTAKRRGRTCSAHPVRRSSNLVEGHSPSMGQESLPQHRDRPFGTVTLPVPGFSGASPHILGLRVSLTTLRL